MPSRLTIEFMQKIASKRGGKCLSENYINANTKLLWECSEGHQWEATPHNIKNGGCWCPYCAGNARLTLKDMQKIAEELGGKCLSEEYVNSEVKLLWECSEGHKWEAKPSNIRNGKWCPYCANCIPLTIQDMQEIAAERGGKCLSEEYVNGSTKLLWECSEGHRWEATPGSIKYNKNWCSNLTC